MMHEMKYSTVLWLVKCAIYKLSWANWGSPWRTVYPGARSYISTAYNETEFDSLYVGNNCLVLIF